MDRVRMAEHIATTSDNAAKVAKAAHKAHISVREAAIKLGFVTAAEFDALVKPEDMTHP